MKEKPKSAAPHRNPHGQSASVLPMLGLCSQADRLTEQDVRNMPLYTWLLIAEEDGADIEDIAASVMRFDLETDCRWAIQVTRSYLDRARWVQDQIFPTIS